MSSSSRLWSVLFVAAWIRGSCQSPPQWRELRSSEYGFGRLWEEFEDIGRSQGYPPDDQVTDRGLRIYQSKWRTIEAAFGNAHRTRLHAEFEITRPK